jgi:diguanylate cyclase (GGDEF)-like protein
LVEIPVLGCPRCIADTLRDTNGHEAGDLLLQQVSDRLVAIIREGDTAARIGGDEFVVMLEYLGETREEAIAQARAAGKKILAALGCHELAGRECHCTPNIGIALFNAHENTVDELLRQADTAMYQAKAGGRNALCFYDPALNGTAMTPA